MDILNYTVRKISMLLLMISIPAILAGQSESGDSISNNFVRNDTAGIENIIKPPELQVKKTPESMSSRAPMIPMSVPGMSMIRHSDLLKPPRYSGYESIKNLNLPPPKNLLDLIRENPLLALYYGLGTLAGMVNHTVIGEDKMNLIRLENMIQSHSGIPETAISGNGAVYYEIDVKRKK
ncbi:MAG: hypothetical protein LBS43_03355 [Prevotellaceae bacterium]|jgi:hypothetical protein|nr:hypothetical protein [Prevotellaceae bacterium]